MSADDLTTEQAQQLRERLVPMLAYLGRLRERMDRTGFVPSDRLYGLTSNAYDAMHALTVELHYLSCGGGCGRPSHGVPRESSRPSSGESRDG